MLKGQLMRKCFPVLVGITLLYGGIYTLMQQNYRQSANDPQIQMAEDGALALSSGKRVQAVIPGNHIDLAQSLSPFIIVYDSNGTVASSSAVLNGSTPVPPPGVFDFVAKNNTEDRFTWQPSSTVRIATVVVKYNGGFVLAGRSLREVEKREDQLVRDTLLAWIGTVLVFLLSSLF